MVNKRLTFSLIAILVTSSTRALIVPIFDPSYLQQQVLGYIKFIEQNSKLIIYDEASKKLNQSIVMQQVKDSDNRSAALVKGLSEAKIKAANRVIATHYSSIKNACDIESMSQSVSQLIDEASLPLKEQEKNNLKNKIQSFVEQDILGTTYPKLQDNMPPRLISQVSRSNFYLDELSAALRAELMRSIKQQNKNYQKRISLTFIYFIKNNVLLLTLGNMVTQKRYLVIQRSMQLLNRYYAYRISINQRLLTALAVQLYLEKK